MFDECIQSKELCRFPAQLLCGIIVHPGTMNSIHCSPTRFGFLIEGYQAGVLGGVQDTKLVFNATGNPTGTETIPMSASLYTLAAAFISNVVMLIGMTLGRRRYIIIGNVFIAVGGVVQAASFSGPQIIVARVLCVSCVVTEVAFLVSELMSEQGFGIAFTTCNVPMYMSEMSIGDRERGLEVAINCSCLLFGVTLSYLITFGFTRMTNQISWRIPVAFQTTFANLSGVSIIFLPDAPRWYYARDNIPEGDKILSRIYGVHCKGVINHGDVPEIQAMGQNIMENFHIEEESSNRLTVLTLAWDNTPLRVGRRVRIPFLILAI
ncbi:hypothetical protein PMG11_00160 [Penicillium brasilianum]|uniref:Major facilitator superfamily (MFS) profile domain-containing protein n=1 Tax=Penicillium brasilianum TaxID=104259 RepID=A0A0F7TB77_PENBI|nr:hypothetical protein PMG11_00160 [Penicillium brasilianum]